MQTTTATSEATPIKATHTKTVLSVKDGSGEVFTRLTHRPYTHVCVTDVTGLGWGGGHTKVVTWHTSIKNAKPPYFIKGSPFEVVEVK
jgi:hypothetical protein